MKHFDTFFNPKSVAVVGASRSPSKVGNQILKNLIHGGFKGKLYPINPNAKEILHLKCYPTLHDVRQPIDLAIIATPAPLVATILTECIQHKIQNAIIITAGFAESGARGQALQQELKQVIAGKPIQVIGPNCLGTLSPINALNASFGPKLPQAGSVMVISQSGALVTGILDWAALNHIGISHAITFGNRIDSGELEALEFAARDKKTKTILIYLESFQNASAFFELCSRITPHKPIILLKGGQTSRGQSASASHTAALASDYTLVKAFADQTGVVVARTLGEWLELGQAFSMVPAAKGRALTILTNAGGPGVTAADEAEGLGIPLPELSAAVARKIRDLFPNINPHNPLDMIGDATPETLARILQILTTEQKLENLLLLLTPQTTTNPRKMAEILAASPLIKKIPVYAAFIGGEKMEPARDTLTQGSVLHFDYPNQALPIIAKKSSYEWYRPHINHFPANRLGFTSKQQQASFAKDLRAAVTLPTAFSLLHAYGFVLPKSAVITQVSEVPEALEFCGKPAVLKTAGMQVMHKASAGGVMLHIMSAHEARLAFRKLQLLHPQVLVQQMVHGELELILGAKRDVQLGPFVTVGLGGSLTNVLADRAYAFVPAQKSYLSEVLQKTKAWQLLVKHNLPVNAVIDAMQRLSAIITDIPDIAEIEINPVIVAKKRLYAADIKIKLDDGATRR